MTSAKVPKGSEVQKGGLAVNKQKSVILILMIFTITLKKMKHKIIGFEVKLSYNRTFTPALKLKPFVLYPLVTKYF